MSKELLGVVKIFFKGERSSIEFEKKYLDVVSNIRKQVEKGLLIRFECNPTSAKDRKVKVLLQEKKWDGYVGKFPVYMEGGDMVLDLAQAIEVDLYGFDKFIEKKGMKKTLVPDLFLNSFKNLRRG